MRRRHCRRRRPPDAERSAGWVTVGLRRRLGERVPCLVLPDWRVRGAPPGFGDALVRLRDPDAWTDVRDQLLAMWTEGVADQPWFDARRPEARTTSPMLEVSEEVAEAIEAHVGGTAGLVS